MSSNRPADADADGTGTGAGQDPPALTRAELTELTRAQMRKSIGGWSGTIVAAVPTVVFVAVNALSTLRVALIAAVASAVLLAGYRLVRHEPTQHALSGLVGVVIAALIANHTGQARGYFLYGIVLSFVYFAVLAVSMLLRRPLVGLAWEFVDPVDRRAADTGDAEPAADDDTDGPDPATSSADTVRLAGADEVAGAAGGPVLPWYRRPALLRAYQLATGAGALVFLARGVVQLALYDRNSTGWLAVARIAMGVPLYLLAVAFGVYVVTRARRQAS